ALAKSRKTGKRQTHRGRLDASVAIEPGAEAQRLAPSVLAVDLVALDASDFQPETVRSEVDDGERLHGQAKRAGLHATKSGARKPNRIGASEGDARFGAPDVSATLAASSTPSFRPVPIDYLQRILNAKVYDVAIESPLEPAPMLSRRIGNRVLLKREDKQEVFSFKLRGAYNRMAHLSSAERARGVVAASAGNHAQGVALAAQRLGCKATIVMPVTSPSIKIQAVEERGATVVLHGDSYSDAYAHAVKLQKARGATFIHPYDDPDVIAGQGTI